MTKVPGQFQVLEDAFSTLDRALKTLERVILADENSITVDGGIDFYAEVSRFEMGLIKQALRSTEGHQIQAAALLRLSPQTLNKKIKNYMINPAYPYIADSQNLERRAIG
jgi:DNA-binding NtrC family response regulator